MLGQQQPPQGNGAQPPDASVLVRALTVLCRKPLENSPEVSFRVQLARSSLQVDIDPDVGKVDSLYGHFIGRHARGLRRPAEISSLKWDARGVPSAVLAMMV